MDKIDVSRKESLWLYGVTIGVFSLSNFSVAYPVVGIIQSVLLFALMVYSIFRLIQTFKDAQRNYNKTEEESRMKQVNAALRNPQIIQAFETVLNQAGRKNVGAPDDGPKLVEAMREVAKQAKEIK